MKVLRVNISGFVGREVSVTALLLLQHTGAVGFTRMNVGGCMPI